MPKKAIQPGRPPRRKPFSSLVAKTTIVKYTQLSNWQSFMGGRGGYCTVPLGFSMNDLPQAYNVWSLCWDQYRVKKVTVHLTPYWLNRDTSTSGSTSWVRLFTAFDPDGGDPGSLQQVLAYGTLKTTDLTPDRPTFKATYKPGTPASTGQVLGTGTWFDMANRDVRFEICQVAVMDRNTASVNPENLLLQYDVEVELRGAR